MKYARRIVLYTILILLGNNAMGQAKAADYLKSAIEATNQKKFNRAILLCDAAISLNNTSSPAYFHRGYNKLLLKDYQGAIVDFSVCLDLSPDNLSAYLYRAYSNQKVGNKWESSRDYNSARRIDAIETFAFMAGNLFRSSLGD